MLLRYDNSNCFKMINLSVCFHFHARIKDFERDLKETHAHTKNSLRAWIYNVLRIKRSISSSATTG